MRALHLQCLMLTILHEWMNDDVHTSSGGCETEWSACESYSNTTPNILRRIFNISLSHVRIWTNANISNTQIQRYRFICGAVNVWLQLQDGNFSINSYYKYAYFQFTAVFKLNGTKQLDKHYVCFMSDLFIKLWTETFYNHLITWNCTEPRKKCSTSSS